MTSSLRVAVLQFGPKIGQVQANISRARELCSKLQPRSIDLLCFPEMAFTGYVFESSAAIMPYLEQPRTGPTSLFCLELAKRLHCYVVAGYPEDLPPNERCTRVNNSTGTPDTWNLVGANSTVLYGPGGEWIGGYRKTNLFRTDFPWAKAGSGFTTFHLPAPLGKLTIGICMDLNSQTGEWSLKDGPFELADYCLSEKTDTLLLCNAWLDLDQDEDEDDLDDTDRETVGHWTARLRPLWADDYRKSNKTPNQGSLHDIVVISCNRTGTEKDVKFAGSSTIFKLRQGSGRPVVLDMLTKNEELLQICDIRI